MNGPFDGELKYDAIREPATEAAVSPRCLYLLVAPKPPCPRKTGGRPPHQLLQHIAVIVELLPPGYNYQIAAANIKLAINS